MTMTMRLFLLDTLSCLILLARTMPWTDLQQNSIRYLAAISRSMPLLRPIDALQGRLLVGRQLIAQTVVVLSGSPTLHVSVSPHLGLVTVRGLSLLTAQPTQHGRGLRPSSVTRLLVLVGLEEAFSCKHGSNQQPRERVLSGVREIYPRR